jgi:hypothetical protein
LDDLVRPLLHLLMLLQNLGFRGSENTIEASQHRERQNHLAVLISFVVSSKEVADAPNEIGELLVRLDSHGAQNGANTVKLALELLNVAVGKTGHVHCGASENLFLDDCVEVLH